MTAADMEPLAENEEARIAELAQYIPDFEVEPPQASASAAIITDTGEFRPPEYRPLAQRQHPRYLVGWRVAIVNKHNDNHQTWYGRAYDVSLGGINIHSENNLFFSDDVVLLLSMPARVAGNRPKIVEVSGKSLYTILMANSTQFRIGFKFTDFKKGSQHSLRQYLDTIQRVSSLGV